MWLQMLLCFAIGWTASSGSWGLVTIFALLALVEAYRVGKKALALQQKAKVAAIFGERK